MRAIRNSGLAPVPLPAVIRAPRSIPRAVMIPAKGAPTFWNDCSAISRCTLASFAATLARAAPTLASSALTFASSASMLARAAAVVARAAARVLRFSSASWCATRSARSSLTKRSAVAAANPSFAVA